MAQSFKTGITVDDATAASSQAVATNVNGDSNNRLSIDAGGKITWGSGSGAGDTTLYRGSANTLKTDDAFTAASLAVTGQFTLPTVDGSADQIMVTDGSGGVTWEANTASASPAGSDGQIQYNNGGSTGGASGLSYDDTNNRVGIGTTTPGQALHVEGGLQYVTPGGGNGHFAWASGSNYLTADDDAFTYFRSYDSVADSYATFAAFDCGNERLGIGTSSPTHKLTVAGDISLPSGNSVWIGGTGQDLDRLRLHHSSGTGHAYIDYRDDLNFRANGTGSAVVMDSAGQVGIGIDPTVPLQVSSGTDNVAILAGSTDATCRINMFDSDSTGNSYVGIGAIGDDLALWAGNSRRITIDSTGNVGIGDTTPGKPLHLANATEATIRLDDTGGAVGGAINARVQLYAGGAEAGSMGFPNTGGGLLQIENKQGGLYLETDTDHDISLRTNGSTRMTVDGDGRVGVGTLVTARQFSVTASQTAFNFWNQLDVGTGNRTGGVIQIGASGNSTNPDTGDYWILFRRGNGSTIGSVRGTGSNSVNFATSSDATLKDDNGPVTEVRVGGIIDDLLIHDFDWKEGDVKNQIGVFAQEAIEVLPYGVVSPPGEDEDGGYLPASLDYSKIVPILVAEAQFMRTRVATLEAAVADMAVQVDRLDSV